MSLTTSQVENYLASGVTYKFRTFCIGDIVRHFKGDFYRIVAFAKHSESEESLIVYCKKDGGPESCCARPFEMFFSEVDHEKYPDVLQKFRFELVNPASAMHDPYHIGG